MSRKFRKPISVKNNFSKWAKRTILFLHLFHMNQKRIVIFENAWSMSNRNTKHNNGPFIKNLPAYLITAFFHQFWLFLNLSFFVLYFFFLILEDIDVEQGRKKIREESKSGFLFCFSAATYSLREFIKSYLSFIFNQRVLLSCVCLCSCSFTHLFLFLFISR